MPKRAECKPNAVMENRQRQTFTQKFACYGYSGKTMISGKRSKIPSLSSSEMTGRERW